MLTGNRSTSNCRRYITAVEIHGADGSTQISIHRRTSSHGKPLHSSPATPIESDRARWSYFTPAQSRQPRRPGRPVQATERGSAWFISGRQLAVPIEPGEAQPAAPDLTVL